MDHRQQVLTRTRFLRSVRRSGGFTLVEAVVATAILAVILLIASQVSIGLSAITAEESDETQIQTDVRRAISEITFLIEESRPVAMWREDQLASKLPHIAGGTLPSVSGTNTNPYNFNGNEDMKDRGLAFTFAVPMKATDGRVLSQKYVFGMETFGYSRYGSGNMGASSAFSLIDPVSARNTYTVFFRPDGNMYNEAAEDVDIDSNGTKTDVFIFGGLFITHDATGEERQITGRIAIKRFIGLSTFYPDYNPTNDRPERDYDGRGKVFFLECEKLDRDENDNGVYDREMPNDSFIDRSEDNRWDVKMSIRFYFLVTRDDPRRGKVTRLRALNTRVNYFRNTTDKLSP